MADLWWTLPEPSLGARTTSRPSSQCRNTNSTFDEVRGVARENWPAHLQQQSFQTHLSDPPSETLFDKLSPGSILSHVEIITCDHDLQAEDILSDTMLAVPADCAMEARPQGAVNKLAPKHFTSSASTNESPAAQHDSAYYSTKELSGELSEIDANVQARQIRARERLAILRGRVLRTRRRQKEHRSELARLREDVREASDKLTRKIREVIALGKLHTHIDELYVHLQSAQDRLGPAEDELDQIEGRLDEEEQELEQEEDHFYRHYDVFGSSVPDSTLDAILSPLIEPYDPPETIDGFDTENGLLREYLMKIEEAKQLKGEVEDLESTFRRFSKDVSFRQRNHIPPSAEASTFLANFENFRAESIENLRKIEDIIFQLRSGCIEQDIFTDADFLYEAHDDLYDDLMDMVDETLDRSLLRVAAQRAKYSNLPSSFADKRDHVNRWLLELVQNSTIDTMMLQSWLSRDFSKDVGKGKMMEHEAWPERVLSFWDKDEAGALTNDNYNASRLDAITGASPRQYTTATRGSGRLFGPSRSLQSLDVRLGENCESSTNSIPPDGSLDSDRPTEQTYHTSETELASARTHSGNSKERELSLTSRLESEPTPRVKPDV